MDVTSYLLGKAKGGGGPSPSGTIEITENGTYDVTSKATANVNVSGGDDDLSKYFNSEIKNNTSQWDNITDNIVKNTPPFVVDDNVTDLSFCFQNCKLKKLDVSQMNLSNVTSIQRMFNSCSLLEELKVDNWDVSKVDNFDYLFANCTLLKKLDLSKWQPKSYPNCQSMFRESTHLAIVDYSSFNTVGFYAFYNVGINCLQSDGAYADGIPYIYVKNANVQSQVLNANSGRPSTWTTDNVVIKNN